MPTCIIVGAIVVSCLMPAPKPTAAEAAAILERAPGISNRSHVYVPSAEERQRPRFVFVPAPTPARMPIERNESEQGRANRLGIPGGWTALEWAILHSGR